MLRRLGGAATGLGVAGGLVAYFEARRRMGEDALQRLISYDTVALPAILEYKWEEAKCEKLPKVLPAFFPPVTDDEERRRFEVLHERWKLPLYNKFMELGGFYYKSGQKIASNQGGVVPKAYIDMFQPFLNAIPPRDPAEVRAVMEAELGQPREEVFSTFDETPIGCASIGQAHRATLKATGEHVVVKVQNPEAERTFRGDVFALKVLIDIFMPQLSPAFDEIAKQFATEFDYRGECKNAMEIRANLQRSPFKDQIVVPRVHESLCTKRLMVMEEIRPSIPLHHALDAQAALLARQRGMTKAAFLESEKARIEREAYEAARKGRLVRQLSSNTYDKFITLQKVRRRLLVGWRCAFNYSIGLVLPKSMKYDLTTAGDDVLVPINAARLVDELLAVHGYEILIDGCFNADPHPGNILYIAATDRLGLIDYGQVKRLEEHERLGIAQTVLLVEAAIKVDPRTDPKVDPIVHERARKAVAKSMYDLGCRTEKNDVDTSYHMSTVYFGRMDAAWLYPMNLLQWSDEMQARDPLKTLENVEFFIMISMASMMLRGLGEMLQQYRNLATTWAPYARQALAEKGRLRAIEDEIASWHAK